LVESGFIIRKERTPVSEAGYELSIRDDVDPEIENIIEEGLAGYNAVKAGI